MSYVKRAVLDNFKNNLKPNKVLVLLGARRVGKTQLIKKYLETVEEKVLQLNGEDLNDARLLEERTLENQEHQGRGGRCYRVPAPGAVRHRLSRQSVPWAVA